MKPASPHRLVRTGSRRLALALVSLFATISAQAASTYWWDTNTTGLWATSTNWWTTVTGTTHPAAAPLAADSVIFNGTGKNGATVVQLNAATPITGITFANTGTTLINASAAGTQALTIGTGGITLNSGAGAVTIGDATNQAPITLGGAQAWTNNSTSLFTVVNAVTNGSNLLTIDGTGNTTINGVIGNGSGGLAKIGAGTLVLSGANTYTGTTTVGSSSGVNAGTLRLSGSGKISNAATTVYGGTLDLNDTTQAITTLALGAGAAGSTATLAIGAGELQLGGGVTYTATNNPNGATLAATSGKLSLFGNRTFTVGNSSAAAADLSVSAIIQNGDATARSLTKEGAGTLVLSGANTYSGATNINVGVLYIQHDTALGTTAAGTTVAAGAALQMRGDVTVGSEALTLNGSGISSDGALRNISGANTWQGTVTLAGASRINSDTGILTFDTAANSITGTNPNLTLGGAADGTVGGTITTGTGTLTKDGAGTWTLGGTNTYSGATTLTAGTLSIETAANLGSAANALVFDGGTLQVTGTTLHNFVSHATTFNATKTVGLDISDGGNTFTASQVLNQTTGGLTKLGAGMLVLTNTNTYTGATTLSGGILSVATIGDGGVAGNLGQAGNAATNLVIGDGTLRYTGSTAGSNRAFTINGGQTVTFDITSGATTLTLSGAAAATSGSLTKIGAGTLILAGANAYTGATTLSAGILKAGSTNAFGNNSAVALDDMAGVAMDITGFNTVIGSLSGGGTSGGNLTLGAATLTVGGDNSSTDYAGVITGLGGALIKTGSGILTLSGTNGFTGATTLTAGTVSVGTTANLGASNPLVFDGGTLQITGTALASYGGGFLGTHAVTLTAGKTVGFDIDDSGHTFTVSQVLNQPPGGLTKLGGGTLTLAAANTYTGATALSAGTLRVGVLGTLASGALGSNSALTLSNGSTLDLNNYNTWIGSLTGNGSITLGTATLTVGGNNTSPAAYSGAINGSGSLTKIGSGTLILSGTNGYTGATTLNEGVLSISSLASLGSAANPLIFNGGTLQVTGGAAATFGSHAVTFNTGQTVVFDITGANTFTASQTLNQGTGGLTKLGSGTLILSDTNTFSGRMDMQNGTLKVVTVNDASANGVFGNSALPVILGHSGTLTGMLQYTGGTAATNKKFTLATGGTGKVQVDSAGTVLTLSGAIDGGGNLIKSGTGTLTLSGTNTYAGETKIIAGTLRCGANDVLPDTGAITLGSINNNTTLDLNGYNDAVPSITYGVYNDGDSANITTGAGTLTLNGNINAGDTNTFGPKSISGNLNLGGLVRTVTIGTNGGNNGWLTISALITNGGINNIGGNYGLILSGANTYSSGTTLTSGTVQIGTDPVTSPSFLSSAIGTGTLTMGAGGISSYGATPRTIPNAVAFTGGNNTATTLGNATNNGKLTFSGGVNLSGTTGGHALNLSSDAEFAGVITGGGQTFSAVGTGTLILSNPGNNFTGTFGVGKAYGVSGAAGGNLRWGANNVFPDGVTMLLGGTGTINLDGYIDTVGAIYLGLSDLGQTSSISTGAGTLTLAGNISSDSNAFGNQSISGYLALGALTRTFGVGASSANTQKTVTLSAAISGGAGAGIINSGNGFSTTILSGQNTYTGTTTLTSGNLRVGSAETVGVSGPLGKPTTPAGSFIFAGGTLQYSAANYNQFDYVSRFTTSGTTPYSIDTNSQNVTFTNGLGASGTSGLTKSGAGTLTLNATNLYTGATTVTGGILRTPDLDRVLNELR